MTRIELEYANGSDAFRALITDRDLYDQYKEIEATFEPLEIHTTIEADRRTVEVLRKMFQLNILVD